MVDLSGKNILLTGASRGIGSSIAKHLSAHGASVALHYHENRPKAEKLAYELAGNHTFVQADLGKTEDIHRLTQEVLDYYGHIDVLINNAGIALSAPMESDSLSWFAVWNRTLQVNLSAAALLCQQLMPHFIDRRSGIIINISSRAAFRGDTSDYAAYASSKAGLLALTKTLARAYGKQGITAFSLAPGFTETDMAQDFIDRYGIDRIKEGIALPELTKPEDIAPTVTFLASGLARHATGTTIDLNAGSYMR